MPTVWPTMARFKALPIRDGSVKPVLGRVRADGSIGKPKAWKKTGAVQKQRKALEAVAAAAVTAEDSEKNSSEEAYMGTAYEGEPAGDSAKPGEFKAKHIPWDEVGNLEQDFICC